jgi:hypothetical protein
MYIHFGCPKNWRNEWVIPAYEPKIIPDATFAVDGNVYFLEVDHMQKMKENYAKIDRYKKFKDKELWQRGNNGTFPILVFYTTKDSRQCQLKEYCKQKELNCLVYTKEDLA